jgi:PAS domain-containing protein
MKATLDLGGRAARLILIALAFAIIVVNGVLAFAYLSDLHNTVARVNHSLQVTRVLKGIDDLAQASGHDERAYRLYGDVQRLESFRRAQSDLPDQLARLRDLIVDEGNDQLKRFGELSTLIERNLAERAPDIAPVEARSDNGHMPQELAASLDRTIAIVTATDVMLANEQSPLDDRLAAIESSATIKLATGMLVRSGAIVLVVVVILIIYRKSRRNEELAKAHSGALQESELRFRRVFDESPLGMLLAQQDGQQILQANPAFCRMLGYDADEMVGKGILGITHIDDHDLLNDAIGRATSPNHVIEAAFSRAPDALRGFASG